MLLFLSLFLLAHQCRVVRSISCQSDRNTDHRPRVSCVGQGLTMVPDGIHEGTQVLVLSQNQFSSLSWTSYSKYTCMHELDLSRNHIKVIDPSGSELQNLRVLRLSNNRLEGLGGRVFRFAPALMEVYLDGNNLRTLHDATFGDLPQLEVINLSSNKLPALPRRLLETITSTSLKTFDLEDNRVQHLPDGFFSSKPELPYVYLSQNPWQCGCQVGYLQQYLEDQGHNVYKHTSPSRWMDSSENYTAELPGDRDMKASIENDPESVVCAGPQLLKGLTIVDLQEDQYCNTDISPVHELGTPTIPSTSEPTSASETQTIIPTTEEATIKSTPQTASATITTTGAPPVQAFTTPSIWIRQSWTVRYFLSEVWTYWIPHSRTVKDIKTTRTELSHQRTSKALSVYTLDPRTSENPVTWTSSQVTRPQSTSSTSHQRTSTRPPMPTLDSGTSLNWTFPQATTSQDTYSTSHPKTSRGPSSGDPGPETSVPFYHTSGASQAMSGCMVPWCWWLFAGFLPLCILSALCSCMLFLWILLTYINLYRPIQRQIHMQDDGGVTLLTFQTNPEDMGGTEMDGVNFLPPEKIPIESQAVFRSVLFIVKEDEEVEEKGEREEARAEDSGSVAVSKIELVPAWEKDTTGVMINKEKERDRQGSDVRDMFRKTLYRVISREEEIEGWREVEESWEPAKPEREREVERGKKRYSLILREDKGSVEDRDEGVEWLVGEWEMGGQGGMMRESYGSLIRRIERGSSLTAPTPVARSQADTPGSNGGGAIYIGVGDAQNRSRAIQDGGGAVSERSGDSSEGSRVIPENEIVILEGGGATAV